MALNDQHSVSVRTKRKPSNVAASDVSSSKRRRLQAPIASTSSTAFKPHSKLLNRSTPTNFELKSKEKRKTVNTLFSRFADPSVQSPQLCPVNTYVSKEFNPTRATLQEKSLYQRHNRQETRTVPLTSYEEVDLTIVEHVGSLEMVEGDEILQTLIRASTPRVKRRFPSEKALTDSEQRDREALRRRRLKLRSQFSMMKEQPCDDRVEDAAFGALLQGVEVEKSLFKPDRVVQTGAKIKSEEAEDDERAQLIEDEAETDEETTESKINRLSKVMHMNWRQFFLWLLSGAMLLCVMVVAAPFVKKMIEPSLPYCDSEWIEVDEGSYVVAGPVDNFDRSKALQPFVSTASIATRASKSMCRPCPVYGNCVNGSVISCALPYELQHGLCKENLEVQANLDQLALSIQKFIVEKASKNACDNASLWSYLNSDNGVKPTRDATTSIEVWLSDVQMFVMETVSFGKAVSNLPREYVFNRSLDMALRHLKDIFVTEDQSRLVVGGGVVPWSCRAKHQLYAHIKLIALAVALGTVLVFAYRQFLLYRTERQLVDRFVKEVRFFLLDRTRRPDRFYPANHLRDDLFEKQSLQDRKWLCKSVWPKVAAVVKDDSRISVRVMRVRGEDMVVWKWASSSSPSHRRAGGNRVRGLRAVSKPQQGPAGDARPLPSRRRKKDSRMSLT